MKKEKFKKNINIKNKKAYFEFEILEKYIAGIALVGTEVKSLRLGKASIGESYCYIKGNEIWIKQMHIAPYEHGNIYNHDELRERKLLLNRKEIDKLRKSKEKGNTIILLRVFISDRGLFKAEIGLARGKKLYDKRRDLKEKDLKRQMARSNM